MLKVIIYINFPGTFSLCRQVDHLGLAMLFNISLEIPTIVPFYFSIVTTFPQYLLGALGQSCKNVDVNNATVFNVCAGVTDQANREEMTSC